MCIYGKGRVRAEEITSEQQCKCFKVVWCLQTCQFLHAVWCNEGIFEVIPAFKKKN